MLTPTVSEHTTIDMAVADDFDSAPEIEPTLDSYEGEELLLGVSQYS